MDGRLYYSAFMVLALVVFLLARRWTPRDAAVNRLPWQQRALLAMAAFIGGAFGAKLPFVVNAAEGPWNAFLTDGKTITTGLLGAYLAVELVKLMMRIDVKTGDGYALPLALALAVGRWGCFFNGCCAGVETDLPWGVRFGDSPVPRHPTQVYEVIFHATMAVVLWLTAGWEMLRYQRLKLFLIAYGVFRFATEFIRPEPRMALNLTFYQWVAVVMVIGLAGQWAYDEWRKRRAVMIALDLPSSGGV